MFILAAVFPPSQLDHCSIHIEEWNEVQDRRGINQNLISTAGRLVDVAHKQQCQGNSRLHENRNIWRPPLRMNLSERRRQVAIDADDKRYARDSRHRAPNAAGISEGDEK